MIYLVRIEPLADSDLEEAYLWAQRHAPFTAARWLQRLHAAVQSLSRRPERCALAPEHKRFKFEIRQLLFGKKPNVFRILFLIEGDEVRVLRIRRASRRYLSRREFGNL